MRSLRLPIPKTDFEQLAQLGRSIIPSAAPGWTDHNTHDPGIMLLELLAWIADAQIYSLSRLRRDERLSYARLLGLSLGGPGPARGLVWPPRPTTSGGGSTFPWPPGHMLAAGTPVTAADPNTPVFVTTDEIALISANLAGLRTVFADGTVKDWTAANTQDGATFMPFGEAPAAGDRLVLEFDEARAGVIARDAVISIGVQIAARDSLPVTPAEGEDGPALAPIRLRAWLRDSAGQRPLAIVEDTTGGLLRSGVLLLRVRAGARPVDKDYTISLESASGAFLRPPRVQQIAPNVLPIEQIEAVSKEESFGKGLPNETYELKRGGLMYPFAAREFVVTVHEQGGSEEWCQVDDLKASGPDDQVFELDELAGVLSFGNGVNGRIPPMGCALQVDYRVTAGLRGNLPANVDWSVRGLAGAFGTNAEATAGGVDARGLDELRRLARRQVRLARPIVTSQDLESAALECTDLGVARARELAASANRVIGTRVLVVVGPHRADAQVSATESPEFLAEVRARLSRRLPLGQRLEVTAPRYVRVRVTAHLVAAAGVDPTALRTKVRDELRRRLAIVAELPGDPTWPFGRDVALASVKGWLRKVAGVAVVRDVALSGDGRAEPDGSINLGPISLPLVDVEDADIVVDRGSGGPRR